MPSRLGSRLAAVLLPAAILMVPTSVHAQKVVTDDAVGDAQVVTSDTDGSQELALSPAPDETSTDITRTVVAHGNTRLSITVHLRDLVLPSTEHQTYVRVVTPQGQYQSLVGKSAGSRARATLTRKNGRDVECRGIRTAVDGDADTVALSLPTSCIDAPRWVQVGVGVVRVAESLDPDGHTLFADDGHRVGDIRESDVAKGPKVRRG